MKCEKCGTENPNDSLFCFACGEPLSHRAADASNQPQPRQLCCPFCGSAVLPGTVFCSKCGKKLEGAPAEAVKSGKIAGSYALSVIASIIVLFLRLTMQVEYWNDIGGLVRGQRLWGIYEDNTKLLLSVIPVLVMLIAGLIVNGDKSAPKQKKLQAIIINGVFFILMLLFIWIGIPTNF